MDEEVEAIDGTPAQVPLYSKIVSLRLNCHVIGSAAGFYRWSLAKSPDGDLTAANYNTNWQTSNDDPTAREVRSTMLAKGLIFVAPDKLATRVPIFVKRQSLRRLGSMSEGDLLKFTISKDAAGSAGSLTMWGNIWVRANA